MKRVLLERIYPLEYANSIFIVVGVHNGIIISDGTRVVQITPEESLKAFGDSSQLFISFLVEVANLICLPVHVYNNAPGIPDTKREWLVRPDGGGDSGSS